MDIYPPIDNDERHARKANDDYLRWKVRCMDEDVAAKIELIKMELRDMKNIWNRTKDVTEPERSE